MKKEFQSSMIRGGNILTPEKIIITDTDVTWRKRNDFLIGIDSITILKDKISSIEIDENILSADIIITSFGEGRIVAKNFTPSDAKKIKQLLNDK